MNDFNDFDSDTPPQGGVEDDLDADLVMQAERQAEDDEGDEYEAMMADQRRQDAQRRDDDQRDADNRRDGIQEDIDRRADQERAREEAEARKAEVDAGLEFGGVEDVPAERSEGDTLTQEAKDRHAQEMAEHRAAMAQQEADQALQGEQAQNTFYKGGFTDLKGNQVSARDVDAMLANHQAAGGHQAAQERFGLAFGKGSELASAHYAPGGALDAAPTAAEQLGVLRDGQQLSNAQLLQKVEADQEATASREQEADRIGQMGTASERQEAVQYASAPSVEQPAAPAEPAKPEAAAATNDRQANVLREVDRLNPQHGQDDQDFGGQDAHQAPPAEEVDWAKYMGVSDEQAQAVADQVRAEEVRARFLDQESQATTTTPSLAPLDDQHESVAELSDRLNDPATAEGQAAQREQKQGGDLTDWEARLRESQAEQERQREREEQSQDQGMQQTQ